MVNGDRAGDQLCAGYVGVIDGKPCFEEFSDEHGDAKSIDVYKTKAMALERWAHVCRVRLVIEPEPIPQPQSRGRL